MTGSDEGATAEGSESIFRLLELLPGQVSALETRASDVTVAGGAVLHAIDGQGRRLLLVPLAEGESAVEDTASQGVTILPRQLVDAGTERLYVAVTCERPEYRDLFSVLADEMLAALRTPSGPAPAACQVVIDRWRDLLAPTQQRLLGVNALAGLLTELHVLELLAAHDPGKALEYWAGPSGGRFDFMGASASCEVKATTTRDSIQVEIHGALQLDVPEGTRLFLHAEQLERVTTGGDSVPDVFARLRESGVGTQALLRKLADVGYFLHESAAYDKIRFVVLAIRTCEVVEDFPRIVPATLKDPTVLDRITRLRYTIDVTDASRVPGSSDLDHALAALMR
jgi:hypothetical protein